MKRTWIAALSLVVLAAPVWAGSPRILNGTVDATDLQTVRLDAGVGDISVVAVDSLAEVILDI